MRSPPISCWRVESPERANCADIGATHRVTRKRSVAGFKPSSIISRATSARPTVGLREILTNSDDAGPTPAGLLAAAIGGCISASLTLCLNKAHLEPDAVDANLTARMERNESGRHGIPVNVHIARCGAVLERAS
jgi:organic hydroperoxide reductase OsmC/OhrA